MNGTKKQIERTDPMVVFELLVDCWWNGEHGLRWWFTIERADPWWCDYRCGEETPTTKKKDDYKFQTIGDFDFE